MCACLCACVSVFTSVHIQVYRYVCGKPEVNLEFLSSGAIHLVFCLAQSTPGRLNRLVGLSPGLSSLPLSSVEITGSCCCIPLFTWVLEIEPVSSCLDTNASVMEPSPLP